MKRNSTPHWGHECSMATDCVAPPSQPLDGERVWPKDWRLSEDEWRCNRRQDLLVRRFATVARLLPTTVTVADIDAGPFDLKPLVRSPAGKSASNQTMTKATATGCQLVDDVSAMLPDQWSTRSLVIGCTQIDSSQKQAFELSSFCFQSILPSNTLSTKYNRKPLKIAPKRQNPLSVFLLARTKLPCVFWLDLPGVCVLAFT